MRYCECSSTSCGSSLWHTQPGISIASGLDGSGAGTLPVAAAEPSVAALSMSPASPIGGVIVFGASPPAT